MNASYCPSNCYQHHTHHISLLCCLSTSSTIMSVCMHHHHQGLITNKVFNIIIEYASSKCTWHVIIKICIHLNIQSQKSAHPQTSRFCSCWDFKLSESTITQSVITAKLKIIQPYQLILRSANQKSAYVKTLLMSSKALNLLSLSWSLSLSYRSSKIYSQLLSQSIRSLYNT